MDLQQHLSQLFAKLDTSVEELDNSGKKIRHHLINSATADTLIKECSLFCAKLQELECCKQFVIERYPRYVHLFNMLENMRDQQYQLIKTLFEQE